MRIRILACLTVMTVAGAAIMYVTHGAPNPPVKHSARAPYNTTDVVEYLLMSKGRVIADHPDLNKPGVAMSKLSDTQARTVVESITGCINHFDASAGPALTSAFNSADPQRLDNALQRFETAAHHWIEAPYKQNNPCPPPPPPPSQGVPENPESGAVEITGYIHLDYVFESYDVVAGYATLASLVAIVGALATVVILGVFVVLLLVPAFVFYEFQSTPDALDRQTEIARLVRILRS